MHVRGEIRSRLVVLFGTVAVLAGFGSCVPVEVLPEAMVDVTSETFPEGLADEVPCTVNGQVYREGEPFGWADGLFVCRCHNFPLVGAEAYCERTSCPEEAVGDYRIEQLSRFLYPGRDSISYGIECGRITADEGSATCSAYLTPEDDEALVQAIERVNWAEVEERYSEIDSTFLENFDSCDEYDEFIEVHTIRVTIVKPDGTEATYETSACMVIGVFMPVELKELWLMVRRLGFATSAGPYCLGGWTIL